MELSLIPTNAASAATALVTGGAGFIGSHVVEALVAEGHRVRVLDDLSSGSARNLEACSAHCELIVGDIRDRDLVRSACSGVDAVFHLAAFISVPGSVDDPRTADEVNIGGTLNVLLGARDSGVRRVVFSSSAAVYGEPAHVPTAESEMPQPQSPYGVEKLYGEHMARVCTAQYGLETVCLRYFNVYGPRQNPDSEYAAVIPKFAQALIQGQPPTIFGDGSQTRDFLYAGDVARANLLAARSSSAVGRVINVASGQSVSIAHLFEVMCAACGSPIQPRFGPPRRGDVHRSEADVTLARDVLGFEAAMPLEEGLRRTIEAMRS